VFAENQNPCPPNFFKLLRTSLPQTEPFVNNYIIIMQTSLKNKLSDTVAAISLAMLLSSSFEMGIISP
jgi:hypothetical protein